MNESQLKFIRVLLLTLFLGYVGVGTFGLHTHYDGTQFVTHAHPFRSSDHTHSDAEMSMINSLTLLTTVVIIATFVIAFVARKGRKIEISLATRIDHYYYPQHKPSRAPPAFI